MSIIPYLIFNGNCREAIEYYAEVFQTETPEISTFGDMPEDPEFKVPEEAKKLVLHAELQIKDSKIMFSDTFPGMPFNIGNNINLTFISKYESEIKRVFTKLQEGGKVEMELQETFWSKLYGTLTDKFGVSWQLNLSSEE